MKAKQPDILASAPTTDLVHQRVLDKTATQSITYRRLILDRIPPQLRGSAQVKDIAWPYSGREPVIGPHTHKVECNLGKGWPVLLVDVSRVPVAFILDGQTFTSLTTAMEVARSMKRDMAKKEVAG